MKRLNKNFNNAKKMSWHSFKNLGLFYQSAGDKAQWGLKLINFK